MNEEPLDLRAILQALRRRRRLVAALLALGILAGVFVGLQAPPLFVARAGVLLPASPIDAAGRPLRDIDTQVTIAASAAVLDRAGRTLNPPASVRTLRPRVAVHALSPDILEIRAEADSARRAAAIADAVAIEYVAYSSGTVSEDAELETAALRDQANELARRLRDLEVEITAGTTRLGTLDQRSPDGALQAARLESLRFNQLEAARQLSALETRIAEAQLDAQLTRRGLRVLEPAIPPSNPVQGRLVMPIGLGGAVGLLTGIVLALALERGDRRLRSRDEIAQAVGAPVLLAMALPRRFQDADCRVVYTQWAPSAIDSYSLRQALVRLQSLSLQPPSDLVLVALPGDQAAVFLALHVAVFAARSGVPTVLRVPAKDEACTRLRAACRSAAERNASACPDLTVLTLEDSGNEESSKDDFSTSPSRLTVTLLIPGNGQLEAPTLAPVTLWAVIVSSGFATREELASAALTCLDGGHPISGVLVANPDPADRTIGHFPEPLALEGTGPNGGSAADASHPTVERTDSA